MAVIVSAKTDTLDIGIKAAITAKTFTTLNNMFFLHDKGKGKYRFVIGSTASLMFTVSISLRFPSAPALLPQRVFD
jgi:hypothetical protein